MKRYAVLLLLSISILVNHVAGAFDVNQRQEYISNDPCQGDRDWVLFVNGIWNTWEHADKSLYELQKRSAEVVKIPDCISFDLAYNHTNSVQDILESFVQFFGQDTTQYWLSLWRVPLSQLFGDHVIGSSREAQSAYDAGMYLVDEDLSSFVADVNEKTQAGSNVLVVAHSQGNFYANEIYRLIDNPESTAIVAVASPASKVEGPLGHVTLSNDFIHSLPTALDPNSNNGYCGGMVDCHLFITSYLAGDDSRGKILDMMVAFFQQPLFVVSDTVHAWTDLPVGSGVLVYDQPNGNVSGTRERGDQGTVVAGRHYSEALRVWMWKVNFGSDPNGWIQEQYLRKSYCGTANKGSYTVFPTNDLCVSDITASNKQTTTVDTMLGPVTVFSWDCAADGITSHCTATKTGDAVNYCGIAVNEEHTEPPPTIDLCVFPATPTWVDNTALDGEFNWTCTGSGGTSPCAAKKKADAPDLTSQSLTVNGTLANGSTVTFTGVVKNSGTVPITTAFTDNFTYRWGTSGAWIQIGEHIPKTVPFAAGATQTDTSANFTFSSFGSFQAQHCIDSQGQLAESDETNNCTVQTYTVRGGAR